MEDEYQMKICDKCGGVVVETRGYDPLSGSDFILLKCLKCGETY